MTVAVKLLKPEFFGKISLIKNHKHNCSAVALKDSELYLTFRSKFDDMPSSNNKAWLVIRRDFTSIFAQRLKCFKV
jgi:CRP-like cAMP-binding protein